MSQAIEVSYSDWKPRHRVEMSIRSPIVSEGVCFECKDLALTPTSEALIAAALLPAMNQGRPLSWPGQVEAEFKTSIGQCQARYARWVKQLQCVELVGDSNNRKSVETPVAGVRTALFFSGGVDSFYSLLENLDEVTDLVFVHGFDIAIDDEAHARMVESRIRQVGKAMNKRVLCIRTNLRTRWLGNVGGWGEVAHGPAMAAVAHLLGPGFRRIIIAGSDNSEVPWPWGSHPDTDPLWSTSVLEFVHDHREVERIEKIRRITQHKTALNHIRVCWKNRDLKANCCRCEKCLRTMISLKALGCLGESTGFHRPLSLIRVAMIKLPLPVSSAIGQIENLKMLKSAKGCMMIKWALRLAFFRCWLLHLLGWHRASSLRRDEI